MTADEAMKGSAPQAKVKECKQMSIPKVPYRWEYYMYLIRTIVRVQDTAYSFGLLSINNGIDIVSSIVRLLQNDRRDFKIQNPTKMNT